MSRLLVIGAGGYGRAVAELALIAGHHTLVGFVDDRWPDLPPIWGYPVVGRLDQLPSLHSMADAAVPAIGNNRARESACKLAKAGGFELLSLIHPRAVVSPSALLGKGVTAMAGAVVGTEARVEDGAIINANATIDHHAQVGAFAHLGICACMGGGAVLQTFAWLRAGEVLGSGMSLSEDGIATATLT